MIVVLGLTHFLIIPVKVFVTVLNRDKKCFFCLPINCPQHPLSFYYSAAIIFAFSKFSFINFDYVAGAPQLSASSLQVVNVTFTNKGKIVDYCLMGKVDVLFNKLMPRR